MNTILWVLQSLMAFIFLAAGIFKLIFTKNELAAKGMAGVKGLSIAWIRAIGILEVLGAIGIILPMLLNIFPVLTIVSAIGFALIMVPSAIISYNRHEEKKLVLNTIIFLICVFIAYGRMGLTKDIANQQLTVARENQKNSNQMKQWLGANRTPLFHKKWEQG